MKNLVYCLLDVLNGNGALLSAGNEVQQVETKSRILVKNPHASKARLKSDKSIAPIGHSIILMNLKMFFFLQILSENFVLTKISVNIPNVFFC